MLFLCPQGLLPYQGRKLDCFDMIVLDMDVTHVLITFQALTNSLAICFSIFPWIEDKMIGLQLSGMLFFHFGLFVILFKDRHYTCPFCGLPVFPLYLLGPQRWALLTLRFLVSSSSTVGWDSLDSACSKSLTFPKCSEYCIFPFEAQVWPIVSDINCDSYVIAIDLRIKTEVKKKDIH